MRPRAEQIIPLIVLTLSVSRSDAQVRHPAYSGTAVDLKTGQPVYNEDHKEVLAGDRRVGMTSEYRTMDGRILARRSVDFRKDPFVPEFRFVDERDGYTEGAEIVGDSVRLFNRKSAKDPLVEVRLQDYRTLDGQYDKLVSIEMLEAVGHAYLETFFAVCQRLLKPQGLLALQVITSRLRKNHNLVPLRHQDSKDRTEILRTSCYSLRAFVALW